MRCKLRKIESTHNKLRTDVIEGEAIMLPAVGYRFLLAGDPLMKLADVRVVCTTEVKQVEQLDNHRFMFKTANSTYELEVL